MTGSSLRAVGTLLAFALASALVGCSSSNAATAGCSSCQEAYTLEQCQAWGAKAGCKEATTTLDQVCQAGIAGCSFKDCNGPPICDDTGDSSCASCKKAYTQSDCDGFKEAAGCASATTNDVTACGNPSTGCDFSGCDFQPDC
jgi:hypothetical protein